jgi:hypothetical protein
MTSPDRPVKIPNREAALRIVTSHIVGNLQASTTDELVNSVEAAKQLTRAEEQRLEWAIDQVVRRLHAMGARHDLPRPDAER